MKRRGRAGSGGLKAHGLGASGLGSVVLGSGQLDGERRVTGVGWVGGWGAGGSAASAPRPVRRSRPQDSQNWPDRAVPQPGHGSCRRGRTGRMAAGGAGGRECPDDGAASGHGAGAGIDSRIRIPHVSQKSVLSDS